MPTPKLFKKFSSKNGASESSPASDTTVNGEGVQETITATPEDAAPAYSDSLKEAWTAAHREPPKAGGAEKVLNKIGAWTIGFSARAKSLGC